MGHRLIVGGTGMLYDAAMQLAQPDTILTAIARNKQKLKQLQADVEAKGGSLNPLSLDYTRRDLLISHLEVSIETHGPIELAVLWIHSTAPDAPFETARIISETFSQPRIFHVLSSAYANPNTTENPWKGEIEKLKGIQYHEVILGFMLKGKSSRWLTHEEISAGVTEAIESEAERFVVGVVEPWESKP